VTNPVCLEYILKAKLSNYEKGQVFEKNLGPLLGHSIFTADGEQWLWQRKLAAHIFNVRRYIWLIFYGLGSLHLATGI
jgi:cytochrome P450